MMGNTENFDSVGCIMQMRQVCHMERFAIGVGFGNGFDDNSVVPAPSSQLPSWGLGAGGWEIKSTTFEYIPTSDTRVLCYSHTGDRVWEKYIPVQRMSPLQ